LAELLPPVAGDVHAALLHKLVIARRDGQPTALRVSERPHDLDQAYATACALVDALGLRPNGTKIGANTPTGQSLLGLREPLWGRTFAESSWFGEAEVVATEGLGAEAEWIFTLASDLSAAAAQTNGSLAAAIANVALGIEITRPSYVEPMREGGLAIIADNGVHAGLVLGRARPTVELARLADLPVWLAVDGQSPSSGSARQSGVDPLAALVWLARERESRGMPLRRGEVVATGALVTCRDLRKGQTVRVGSKNGCECTLRLQ
jgi:2-keto-4-pentenoate hydratase